MAMLRELLLALCLTGCALDASQQPEPAAANQSPETTSATRVLDLVNYPGTDFETLDVAAGLDKRAATNIIAHRNGADGIAPTGDDEPFTSLAELDAVPYVGPSALGKLDTYALVHPPPAGEVVETVTFLGWQSEASVWGVNHAKDATELKQSLGLSITQASSLIAARPFASVAQIGKAKYIGSAALYMIRNYSMQWWKTLHYSCTTSFGPSASPEVDGYGSLLESYDQRDPMYWYQTGARTIPTCLNVPMNEDALRQVAIDFAGWTETVQEFPGNFQPGALSTGPSVFRKFLDATLARMDEYRADRVADGDPDAQAEFDALQAAYGKVAYLTEMHAAGTYSLEIQIEASECSERAVLFVDPALGLVILMHQPPQC
jgi:DNA uptake protein ComE-like DNA-binding protein